MVMTFESSRRPCDSAAFATSSYEMNFAPPLSEETFVRAAVKVVLPWSMWPMVPTLTCGLLRSNFSLAMSVYASRFYGPRRALRFGGQPSVGLPTVAPCARVASEGWSRCPGSNWRPRPYQGRALPTELHRPSPFRLRAAALQRDSVSLVEHFGWPAKPKPAVTFNRRAEAGRTGERRVGEEGRCPGGPCQFKKKKK